MKHVLKRRLIAGGIVGSAALFAPLSASATTGEALERLVGFMLGAGLVAPDLEVREAPQVGTLANGDWISFKAQFQEGIQYHVVAAGCDNVADMDVAVADGNDEFGIAMDRSVDPAGAASFVAPYSGWYTVGIKMAQTRNGGAGHFAYTVLYRTP